MPYGQSSPAVALISPTAIEPISGVIDGKRQNRNLSIYTQAMRETAIANKVLFVDCFAPSQKWYQDGKRHTVDGAIIMTTATANSPLFWPMPFLKPR